VDITVTVKIGNVEVELTLEEAAELHAVLGRICGKPDPLPLPYAVPYPVPYRVDYPPHWPYVATCGASGNVTLTVSSTSKSGTIAGGDGRISWGQP